MDRGARHSPRFHRGVDNPTPQGTPSYGSGNGVVVATGHTGNKSGYGRFIRVAYALPGGRTLQTTEAHLSSLYIGKGDRVTLSTLKGLTGGAVGSDGAGASSGPHLHLEAHLDGVLVDPNDFLNPRSATAGGGHTPIPTPVKKDIMDLVIIAPYSNTRPNKLQDGRGIIGPGFGYAFGDEGTFQHITNVVGLSRDVVRPVGGPGMTDVQCHALFVKIINLFKSASSPEPITAAKITQIVNAGFDESAILQAIEDLKTIEIPAGEVVVDLANLEQLIKSLPAEVVDAFKNRL
jgi:hypothetical protein